MTSDRLARRLAILDPPASFPDLCSAIARIEQEEPKRRLIIEGIAAAIQPLPLDTLAALLGFLQSLPNEGIGNDQAPSPAEAHAPRA